VIERGRENEKREMERQGEFCSSSKSCDVERRRTLGERESDGGIEGLRERARESAILFLCTPPYLFENAQKLHKHT
jgi:hypothetical protein